MGGECPEGNLDVVPFTRFYLWTLVERETRGEARSIQRNLVMEG